MKSQSSPYVVVFTLWLLVFSSAGQTMIISPILPQIGDDLSIADAVLGTLVTAYSLMVGLFAILSGPISDKFGRRRILLIGCGTMAVALGLHAFVDSYIHVPGCSGLRGYGGRYAERGSGLLHRGLWAFHTTGVAGPRVGS